jgi:hypothetical protein
MAVVARPMSRPFKGDISKASLALAKSMAEVTELVKEEAGRFTGQTAQEGIKKDEDSAVS